VKSSVGRHKTTVGIHVQGEQPKIPRKNRGYQRRGEETGDRDLKEGSGFFWSPKQRETAEREVFPGLEKGRKAHGHGHTNVMGEEINRERAASRKKNLIGKKKKITRGGLYPLFCGGMEKFRRTAENRCGGAPKRRLPMGTNLKTHSSLSA